jgi:hypothetical protein
VAELKTKPSDEDVSSFLVSLPDDVRADGEDPHHAQGNAS